MQINIKIEFMVQKSAGPFLHLCICMGKLFSGNHNYAIERRNSPFSSSIAIDRCSECNFCIV